MSGHSMSGHSMSGHSMSSHAMSGHSMSGHSMRGHSDVLKICVCVCAQVHMEAERMGGGEGGSEKRGQNISKSMCLEVCMKLNS